MRNIFTRFVMIHIWFVHASIIWSFIKNNSADDILKRTIVYSYHDCLFPDDFHF